MQRALLTRAEALLLADLPVTPLYFNTHNWLMRSSVHDWHEDSLWTRNYVGTYLDAP